jgi:competence protein ComEC
VEKPRNFLTTSAKVFNYQNYLKVRGIEYLAYYPKIEILARGQGSAIISSLLWLKKEFSTNLGLALPEPVATLAGGLILGDKGGLGQEIEAEFRRAGLSHIIVLSGYNITIVANAVMAIFAYFAGAWSWLFGLGAVILFVVMTGGEAAAVRSAVMAIVAIIARRYGRQYDAGVALIFAGFLMIWWNPLLLVFDLGFQLSFLATLGLIYLAPLVSRLFPAQNWFLNKTGRGIFIELKEVICTTTGAQVAVYPWLLWRTGNASLIGFISNIFVLPFIPLAMLGSFLTGASGFVSYYLSLMVSFPTYFLLKYVLQVAHFFANLF